MLPRGRARLALTGADVLLVQRQVEHLVAEQRDAWVFHVTSKCAPVIGSMAGPGVEVCQRFGCICNAPASCCITRRDTNKKPARLGQSGLMFPLWQFRGCLRACKLTSNRSG